MPEITHKRQQERISKSRAAKASLLTGMTVVAFLLGIYHIWWSVKAFHSNKFGSHFSNLMIIVGGLVLNAVVSVKVLLFFETRLLSDSIDADHKKYI